MKTKKIAIPADLKNRIRGFITSRSGLYFRDHDLRNLEDAIGARMLSRQLESPLSYYTFLTTAHEREDEFRELINLLTVKHTYFFRNEPHFNALRETVLPEIVRQKLTSLRGGPNIRPDEAISKPSIRIWSAGCSTGEEPYSIAMAVRDVIEDTENWEIQILATDASTRALEAARRGVYGGNAMRLVTPELREKYFRKPHTENRTPIYEVRDSVKRMVNFGYFNLMEEEFPSDFEIIFCRNVVIYFEFQNTLKIMRKFYESMAEEGYMFIGYSETLQFMQDEFRMVNRDDAIFYKKARPEKKPEEKFESVTPSPGKLEEKELEKALEEISRAELEAKIEKEAEKKAVLPPAKMEEVLARVVKHMHLKEYDEALSLIERAHEIDETALDPYYLGAEIFMNQGRLDGAKENLQSALKLNPLFAPAHYLLGCIFIEENELEKAKESFKKALYIDKNFFLAHFYLANVYRNESKRAEAIREYRNTSKALSKREPSDILAYSGGFNAATLMSVCRDNIERLKEEAR